MDIKLLLLEKCREILLDIMQTPADELLGTPPQLVYIDYGEGSQQEERFILKNIDETCCFDGHEFKKVKTGKKHQCDPVSGMYYKEGHATIGYSGNKAYIDYMVGPRYGRGFEFSIIHDDEKVCFSEEKTMWVC